MGIGFIIFILRSTSFMSFLLLLNHNFEHSLSTECVLSARRGEYY